MQPRSKNSLVHINSLFITIKYSIPNHLAIPNIFINICLSINILICLLKDYKKCIQDYRFAKLNKLEWVRTRKMETLQELFERLNQTDECVDIEAKKASEMGRAALETVCVLYQVLRK